MIVFFNMKVWAQTSTGLNRESDISPKKIAHIFSPTRTTNNENEKVLQELVIHRRHSVDLLFDSNILSQKIGKGVDKMNNFVGFVLPVIQERIKRLENKYFLLLIAATVVAVALFFYFKEEHKVQRKVIKIYKHEAKREAQQEILTTAGEIVDKIAQKEEANRYGWLLWLALLFFGLLLLGLNFWSYV